ncbi:uncharacterized protein LOC133203353 [Saccostrea echinata]|uniref:uncharacterized protein LOC133203353 n=1 Tax=Saccostrea echinata TaxID=191078 RepID=UPI002A82E565|nr:uncharacterized protein LOC133203353 [Saccostrea echinata]
MNASRSIYVLFYLVIMITVSLNQYCSWSKRTAEVVSSCPKTIDETMRSAKTKKCHALANVQKCTEPDKFKYHCLPDHEQSKLLEVCAPEKNISGICVVYNTDMDELQNNHNTTCSNHTKACPSTYLSTSSHFYMSCQKMINVESTFSRIFEVTSPSPDDTQNESVIFLSTLSALLSCIVVIAIAVILWKRRKHFKEIQKEDPFRSREDMLEFVEMRRTTIKEKEDASNSREDVVKLAEIRRTIKG